MNRHLAKARYRLRAWIEGLVAGQAIIVAVGGGILALGLGLVAIPEAALDAERLTAAYIRAGDSELRSLARFYGTDLPAWEAHQRLEIYCGVAAVFLTAATLWFLWTWFGREMARQTSS